MHKWKEWKVSSLYNVHMDHLHLFAWSFTHFMYSFTHLHVLFKCCIVLPPSTMCFVTHF